MTRMMKGLLQVVAPLVFLSLAVPNAMQADMKELATDISRELGASQESSEGSAGSVVVFEESHVSRVAQVEIAHMLLRLHNKYGLKHIALEGRAPTDGQLDTRWASKLNQGKRTEVAAALLAEGEISSAEFAALAFPDVDVVGVDDAVQYAKELDPKDGAAGTLYLVSIAQQHLSQSEIKKVNELTAAKKIDEAIATIVDADPWTKDKYRKIGEKCHAVSAEDMSAVLKDIAREATSRGIEVKPELKSSMERLIGFYEAASARSDAMVANTANASGAQSASPVAMIIGAAHTARVTQLLKERALAYAVITPQALAACHTDGDLDPEAYTRKTGRRSVDRDGRLGALLDGRRKPPPVVDQSWLHSKAELYYATTILAHAAAGGESPPFASVVGLDQLHGVRVHLSEARVEGSEVGLAPDRGTPQMWA